MHGPPEPRGPRLRDLGLRIGALEAGPANAITDVPGVRVGHVTVWRDAPQVARTGVTAITPGTDLFRRPVPAGGAVLNGAGELTGYVALSEWGTIETPVYLTSTMAVGRIYDGAVAQAVADDPAVGLEDVVIPVVGECDDSWLNTAAPVQVEAADAGRALAAASGGAVAEGAVGAGTGMVCFDWKAGIGSASRVVPEAEATVGVLVLANFGSAPNLRIDGVPVGRLLPGPGEPRSREAGSCIAVLATDAPLHGAQLQRLARRAGLGLARTGSVAHHGSGEIFVAFATTGRVGRGAAREAALRRRRAERALRRRRGRRRGGRGQRALGRARRHRPRGHRARAPARAGARAAARARPALATVRPMLTGRCACGAVQFEVTEPLTGAGWCHCSRCQHRTGTPASPSGAVAPGSFRLTAGEELVTEWPPPGGGNIKAFCSVCGGHVYSRRPDGWEAVVVRLGAIDGDPGVRPAYRQHVASASAWEPLPDDGLPRFPGARDA